jgi:hypothetical protein
LNWGRYIEKLQLVPGSKRSSYDRMGEPQTSEQIIQDICQNEITRPWKSRYWQHLLSYSLVSTVSLTSTEWANALLLSFRSLQSDLTLTYQRHRYDYEACKFNEAWTGTLQSNRCHYDYYMYCYYLGQTTPLSMVNWKQLFGYPELLSAVKQSSGTFTTCGRKMSEFSVWPAIKTCTTQWNCFIKTFNFYLSFNEITSLRQISTSCNDH